MTSPPAPPKNADQAALLPPDPARSAIMRAVKGRDTGPERTVRRLLHRLGYRYRLHARGLPGKPDLAFTARRRAVFVHGCFWHGHDCSRGARAPKRNAAFWAAKIARNVARDADVLLRLEAMGWRALVVWECELRDAGLGARLTDFLGPTRASSLHRDAAARPPRSSSGR